ncbi:MAG: HAMP domain-containing histidine kinase [Bdellovibrionaceae bacterium]|nr:HAMP domain-containing histidine kinase [Pseudobdellovibrionaceae bacterium]
MKIQSPGQRIKAFEQKQVIVSGLCFLFLAGLAVVFNALHLQNVAEENTRFLSRMVKIGDFREASLILQQARLSSFTMIHYRSTEPGRSFVIPPKAEIFKEDSYLNKILRDEIAVRVDVSTATHSGDEIIFEYERFRLVPYAILIWFILNMISIPQTRFLKRRLLEQFDRDIEIEKKIAKTEVAQQVRHNLRTPLAALMHIPSKLPKSVTRERELLELTIGQIRDLISKLDDRPNNGFDEVYSTDIYSTLEQAKRELTAASPKSIEFIFDTEDIVASALVKHIPFELRSILGNIVNNSIEAMNSTGKIFVRIRDLASEISISVSDNGIGIKPESLPKVFQKHFSEGKSNGSGIGLSHAKENVEAWGGRIGVESTSNIGTTVTVNLPIVDRAEWYLPRLKFNSSSKIVVIDDQDSALELWKIKFEESQILSQVRLSTDSQSLNIDSSLLGKSAKDFTYLIDHDLSSKVSGFELLTRLPNESLRCLVTGNFDDTNLRASCEATGVYIIPKSCISTLPVVVTSPML